MCGSCMAQERVDAQVKALKDELERRETTYKEELTTMERKFLEDKSRILRNHADQFTVRPCVYCHASCGPRCC